jgi:hypothetical protein
MGGGTGTGGRARLKFEGSPYDSIRAYVYGDGLPAERAGYILARQALYYLSKENAHNENIAAEFSDLALHQLTDETTADLHQPPLGEELRDLAKQHLEEYPFYRGEGYHRGQTKGSVTALILNMIIDHGSQPS